MHLLCRYSTIQSISANNLQYTQYAGETVKRGRTEEEYFNEEDDNDYAEGAYSRKRRCCTDEFVMLITI